MQSVIQFLSSLLYLSPELRTRLDTQIKTEEISRKKFVLRAGHVCKRICFIEHGLFRCFYLKEDQEVCSWFMKEGDVMVSVESFYLQKSSYESIQALEDSVLSYIDYNELQAIYRDFPEFNFLGRVLTEKYYCLSEQRLFSIRMQRAQERYDYLMAHHPELILRVPAKYLASYLGITEVTLSKIKSR